MTASDFNRATRAVGKVLAALKIRCHETRRLLSVTANVTIKGAGLDDCFVRKAEVMRLCTTVAREAEDKCHGVHHTTVHGNAPAQFLGHREGLIFQRIERNKIPGDEQAVTGVLNATKQTRLVPAVDAVRVGDAYSEAVWGKDWSNADWVADDVRWTLTPAQLRKMKRKQLAKYVRSWNTGRGQAAGFYLVE